MGWTTRERGRATHRRVALVSGDYVAVIQLQGPKKAVFITEFVASARTIEKVRSSGRWK